MINHSKTRRKTRKRKIRRKTLILKNMKVERKEIKNLLNKSLRKALIEELRVNHKTVQKKMERAIKTKKRSLMALLQLLEEDSWLSKKTS